MGLIMLLVSIITIAVIAGLIYTRYHKPNRSTSGKQRSAQKKQANSKSKSSTKHSTKNSAFHCVETHHHAKCCKAVKALHGKRFLSSEAPALPVQGCDQAHCECDYIHHDDRRAEIRRTDMGIQHDMYGQNGEVEHRNKNHHGRRKAD